jgi:hypothetical protein
VSQAAESEPARQEALAKELVLQRVAHGGEMHEFVFKPPAHLLPPTPPHFKALVTPLQLRVMIRMGLEEVKRVELGWFRTHADVRPCALLHCARRRQSERGCAAAVCAGGSLRGRAL